MLLYYIHVKSHRLQGDNVAYRVNTHKMFHTSSDRSDMLQSVNRVTYASYIIRKVGHVAQYIVREVIRYAAQCQTHVKYLICNKSINKYTLPRQNKKWLTLCQTQLSQRIFNNSHKS
jgi:hypothetical protein